MKVVPEVLVAGGGGSVEGLAATLMLSLVGGPDGDGDGKRGGSAKEALDAVVSEGKDEVPPPPVSG